MLDHSIRVNQIIFKSIVVGHHLDTSSGKKKSSQIMCQEQATITLKPALRERCDTNFLFTVMEERTNFSFPAKYVLALIYYPDMIEETLYTKLMTHSYY